MYLNAKYQKIAEDIVANNLDQDCACDNDNKCLPCSLTEDIAFAIAHEVTVALKDRASQPKDWD